MPAIQTVGVPPTASASVPRSSLPPSAVAPAMAPTTATAPSSQPTASASDAAQRTAHYLIQTHGRLEAENRAARVAEFYGGSAEGTFWRRVLRNVRQEPDR